MLKAGLTVNCWLLFVWMELKQAPLMLCWGWQGEAMAVCALQCDTGAGIWGHVTNVPVSAGGTHRHCPATAPQLSTFYNQLNIYAAPFISRRPGRRSSDGGRRRRKGRVAMSTCQCPPLLSALCALLSSPDIIDGKLYAWHPVLDNK